MYCVSQDKQDLLGFWQNKIWKNTLLIKDKSLRENVLQLKGEKNQQNNKQTKPQQKMDSTTQYSQICFLRIREALQ